MEAVLNVRPDVPSINKRIYSKEIISSALDVAIKKGLNVYLRVDHNHETEPAGKVTIYQINNNNEIKVNVSLFDNISGNTLKTFLEIEGKLVIAGVGIINEYKEVISYELDHLFPLLPLEEEKISCLDIIN